jgi:hypothetical protein
MIASSSSLLGLSSVAKSLSRRAAVMAARTSLPEYCRYVVELEPAKHHLLMLKKIQSVIDAVAAGSQNRRLMI